MATDPHLLSRIEAFWDADADVYDGAHHAPARPTDHSHADAAGRAAWAAALARLLPPAPARVLDVGAGTGFLTLTAARLGHRVTAVDISERMLERLRAGAQHDGLEIDTVKARADAPPAGPFDAVMERHLLWTLPDPVATLRAWRDVAPGGTVLLFEGLWGGADPVERVRGRLRATINRMLRRPPGHHAHYPPEVLAALPLVDATTPARVSAVMEQAGFRAPRLERLRDVEWARTLALPVAERTLGVAPNYVVAATV